MQKFKLRHLVTSLLAITFALGIGFIGAGANGNIGHQAPDGKNNPTETGQEQSGNSKVVDPEQLKQQLKQNLKETKSKGKGWIMGKGKSEEIIAHLTLNEKMPLHAALQFAKAHSLEVEQWSTLYDIGSHTYTGGYEIGSQETLIEAKERFNIQFEGFLSEGIADLNRTMQRYPVGSEQYQAAKRKLQSFKQFKANYSKDTSPIVYGIRVKSNAGKIQKLLNEHKINAVGKQGKGRAIYKEIPTNWLKGADKINEKLSK